MQITILILLIIGILLVLYSYKSLSKSKANDDIKNKYEEMFNFFSNSLEEANKVGEDFNKLATDVFAELDNKHQELMVVYKLIEEKHKSETTNKIYENINCKNNKNEKENNKKEFKINIENIEQNKFKHTNKKENVLNLRKQGLQVEDIAKKLNLGKREVKLIIEFSEGSNE